MKTTDNMLQELIDKSTPMVTYEEKNGILIGSPIPLENTGIYHGTMHYRKITNMLASENIVLNSYLDTGKWTIRQIEFKNKPYTLHVEVTHNSYKRIKLTFDHREKLDNHST